MTEPTWLAASAGQAGLAGHVNQFLTTHDTLYIYGGNFIDGDLSTGSGPVATNGTYLAQSFLMGSGQDTTGSTVVSIRTATTNPALLAPTTLNIYADENGVPSGAPLVTLTFPIEFVNGGSLSDLYTYPLPASGLTPDTVYWLVTPPAGDSTNHYNWYKSTATSGALTSPDGENWTAQSYGFQFEIYDQTVILPIYCTWEDGGQRWTATEPGSVNGQLGRYSEYTGGQTENGYLFSMRTYSYTNGRPTGVT